MLAKKHISIISIPSIGDMSIKKARELFLAYKTDGIIYDCGFDDDIWHLTNEYARFSFKFEIDRDKFKAFGEILEIDSGKFKNCIKTYIIYSLGNLGLTSLQDIVNGIIRVAYYSIGKLSGILDDLPIRSISKITEFFSLLSEECNEEMVLSVTEQLDIVEDEFIARAGNGQRTLASFDTYFLFGDILDQFWNESSDTDEKLFFFPVYMWWRITGVLPLRPREFILTPRDCLTKKGDNWFIKIRRSKLKGSSKKVSYKIDSDYYTAEYQIPEKVGREILWYIENTEKYESNELRTLFVTEPHYRIWEQQKHANSRYFTYFNMTTCLRYFFDKIISERYGYEVIFDKERKFLKSNQIQYLNLGDTRHLAMINLIAEGSTPMVAMMLAGHDNPDMSAHYYSNITNLIECRTYRQYKKLLKGKQVYTLSGSQQPLQTKSFIEIPGGWCYSENMANGNYDDCIKVTGPAGEIGFCNSCDYFRNPGQQFYDAKDTFKNQVIIECKNLDNIVKKVRKEKGEPEEIVQELYKLQSAEYSYQRYLEEMMKEDNKCQDQKK